jgi:hypothetical protein
MILPRLSAARQNGMTAGGHVPARVVVSSPSVADDRQRRALVHVDCVAQIG